MRKDGLDASLPLFLRDSNVFPAFIVNVEGKIIAANKIFLQLCGISDYTDNINVKNIFTDNSFNLALENVSGVHTIHSSVNNTNVTWEIAIYNKATFICSGLVASSKKEQAPAREKPFSVFFDNSPALMWATDAHGRLCMMNKRYKEHTGFTDAYLGRSIWDIYPKEMADQFKKNDDIVLKSNELLEIEEVSVDKAGVKRNYIAYKFPLNTAENGVMVAGCSIDITDVLDKTQQLFIQSHLLDSIEQAVYVLDNNSNIIYWSKFAEKMFGWVKEEILNKEVSILVPGGNMDEEMVKKLRCGLSWHGEIDLMRKDGSLVQVHVTKSPVIDENGNIKAFIGISKDISENKIVHKKLVKQNNQFRQIARLQSHAVRRPLANMLGLIDLIQYYSDKQEQEEVLYMISLLKQSSEELDDIIRRIVLKAGVYFDPELRIA